MADSSKLFWYKCLIGSILVGFVKGKICWDNTWYNSSSPSSHGGSDSESQPIDVLNTMCADGSQVIDAHCRDEKGEPFRGFKNNSAAKYVANCTVATGLLCHPYADGYCEDFSIQYGCACPTTLPLNSTAPGTTNAWKGTTSDEGITTHKETKADKGTTTDGNKHGADAVGVEKNGKTAIITNPVLVFISISVARFISSHYDRNI